jgi:hypothetical protein
MADTKISALTSATLPLDGTELLPVVQGGVSKQVAASHVAGAWRDIILDFDSGGAGDWGLHGADYVNKTTWRGMSVYVADADCDWTSRVLIIPNGNIATFDGSRGSMGDDWLWDGLILSAYARIGGFFLRATPVPGPIRGIRRVYYQIG